MFFFAVGIRPLQTIAEHWNEGDRVQWAKVDIDRVAESGCGRCHPGAMPR